METIKFTPSEGLSYDPHDEKYWDKAALRKEIDRTFELCHSCRMCFKYCDTFPAIFDLIDKGGVNVPDFSEQQIDEITEKCFQCKICYFKCPYTKDDNHEFDLDFPRLLMRRQAIKAKEKGIPLRDKLLGNPDLIGKLGCTTAALANWGNHNSLNRLLMEKTIGIHREKHLPSFAGEPFVAWFKKNKDNYSVNAEQAADKVVLFHTCFGNYNHTEFAKDAVFVLWKNNIQVEIPPMNCCGMPALESGNLDFASKEAKQNFNTLFPLIKDGFKVLVLNPTCSLTMKDEYPILLKKLFSEEDLQTFRRGIFDINEYLFTLKREDKLNRDFKSTPGKVAYHIPCHYRAQNIGYRSRDVMKSIGETKFALVDECCGHNGTWAMKKENFKDSLKIGERAFERIRGNEHDIIASDCPLAAIQIEQGTGEKVLHPITILARAYREDGFENKINGDT